MSEQSHQTDRCGPAIHDIATTATSPSPYPSGAVWSTSHGCYNQGDIDDSSNNVKARCSHSVSGNIVGESGTEHGESSMNNESENSEYSDVDQTDGEDTEEDNVKVICLNRSPYTQYQITRDFMA
jgi:hypothetical protein